MKKNPDPDLRALVVWVPMRGGKEKDVREATGTVPDPRATHFWDGTGAALYGFAPTLELLCPAWDSYLIYGPDARWTGDHPPAPRFWMHQLSSHCRGADPAMLLDPATFAAHLDEVTRRGRAVPAEAPAQTPPPASTPPSSTQSPDQNSRVMSW